MRWSAMFTLSAVASLINGLLCLQAPFSSVRFSGFILLFLSGVCAGIALAEWRLARRLRGCLIINVEDIKERLLKKALEEDKESPVVASEIYGPF